MNGDRARAKSSIGRPTGGKKASLPCRKNTILGVRRRGRSLFFSLFSPADGALSSSPPFELPPTLTMARTQRTLRLVPLREGDSSLRETSTEHDRVRVVFLWTEWFGSVSPSPFFFRAPVSLLLWVHQKRFRSAQRVRPRSVIAWVSARTAHRESICVVSERWAPAAFTFGLCLPLPVLG